MNSLEKLKTAVASEYHPIRQRMFWVVLIQWLLAGATLFGVQVTAGFSDWILGSLALLVMGGVLRQGTTSAEDNTVPLDDMGQPLNPEYSRVR